MITFDRVPMRLLLGPIVDGTGPSTSNSVTLDGTTDKVAWIFESDTTDPITRGWVYQTSIFGTSPFYLLALKNVDESGSVPVPGGTVHASGTFQPTTTPQSIDVSFSGSYAPSVIGEKLALEISYSSGTINSSNRAQFQATLGAFLDNESFPCAIQDTTGSYTRISSGAMFGYGTATKWFGRPGHTFANAGVLASTTNGNRCTLKFQIPPEFATLDVYGFQLLSQTAFSSGNLFDIVLANSAGTELLTRTNDTDTFGTATAGKSFRFSGKTTLTAATDYYIGFERNGLNLSLPALTLGHADHRSAWDGGTRVCASTWNGSTWTDDTTKIVPMALLCSGYTLASGGGVLITPPAKRIFIPSPTYRRNYPLIQQVTQQTTTNIIANNRTRQIAPPTITRHKTSIIPSTVVVDRQVLVPAPPRRDYRSTTIVARHRELLTSREQVLVPGASRRQIVETHSRRIDRRIVPVTQTVQQQVPLPQRPRVIVRTEHVYRRRYMPGPLLASIIQNNTNVVIVQSRRTVR